MVAKGFAESATSLLYAQTGADSCLWTLGGGGKTAVLNFAFEPYVQSNFKIVAADAGAGSAIVMATALGPDYWNGTGNWDTPSNWSDGVPGSSSDVIIDTGTAEVTASFGTVASITIDRPQAVTFTNAGANSVAGDVVNPGRLDLDPSSGDGGRR